MVTLFKFKGRLWFAFLLFFRFSVLGHTQNLKSENDTQTDLKNWSLEEKIGQLFFVGFRSIEQIQTLKPGGVILFSWSLKDVPTSHRLLMQIRQTAKDHLKAPLFLATDHEGGKVLRLRKGLTQFPDALAVGATQDPIIAFRVGKIMGVELASLGFNMNFAPVMDLGNTKSFLENRVWSDDEKKVSEMTRHFIRGLSSSRILSVAKHFPGHGGTSVDSHFHLPVISKSWKDLWQNDLLPFREAVNEGLEALMTAHVEVPVIDKGPASLSSRFLSEILREKIGFKGLVISDDLEMGGLSDELKMTVEDLAVKSILAGTDMLMVVWSIDIQRKIANRLKLAVNQGEISEKQIDEKVGKIIALKKRWLGTLEQESLENPYWSENLLRPESLALVSEIFSKAVDWNAGNSEMLKSQFKDQQHKSWIVLAGSSMIARGWNSLGRNDKVLVTSKRPDKNELQRITRHLQRAKKNKVPVVVLTKPQASSSPETLDVVRSQMRTLEKEIGGEVPILWIHLGSKPVEIRREPAQISLGIVSLNTATPEGLKTFLKSFFKLEGIE